MRNADRGGQMQPNFNNPAGRLYAILTELKSTTGGVQTIDVWAKALKIDNAKASLPLLLVRLGKVYSLPDKVRTAMEELPDYRPREVDRWHIPLAQAFRDAHLQTTWNQVSNKISQSILDDIDVCSTRLSVHSGRPLVSEDQLNDIKDEFTKLERIIADANDISNESEKRILNQVHRVQSVVDNIWLEGIDSLTVEVQATVGEVITRPEANPNGKENNTIERVKELLRDVLLVLSLFNQGDTAISRLPFPNEVNPPAGIEQEVDEDEAQDATFREVKALEQN